MEDLKGSKRRQNALQLDRCGQKREVSHASSQTHTIKKHSGMRIRNVIYKFLFETCLRSVHQVVFCLAEVEWHDLWVIRVCSPHFPLCPLLITPQELLKSASHDINSRAFLGKPLSGKLKEEGRPGESQPHRWMDTQRCSFLLPGGPCVFACMCVHEYMLIILLGGGTQSSQCEPPSACERARDKAQKEKALYAGSAHSL